MLCWATRKIRTSRIGSGRSTLNILNFQSDKTNISITTISLLLSVPSTIWSRLSSPSCSSRIKLSDKKSINWDKVSWYLSRSQHLWSHAWSILGLMACCVNCVCVDRIDQHILGWFCLWLWILQRDSVLHNHIFPVFPIHPSNANAGLFPFNSHSDP